MTGSLQVLSPGVGYGIVIGIGGVFAVLMLFFTWLQNRYTSFSTHQSEEFNTASRSVKPGLIAAGIVSSWTWSATLLTSSTFAYNYGACGGMWYGGMGTFQIALFTLIAIKIKQNAPGAHTFPEIVLAKHGKIAHVTYLFMGLATNMLVGACLVLGGAQVVEALSGMNVYAACFLIPIVVAAYVIAGGLRSTFIADYLHTVILFLALLIFGFLMYATSPLVGSLDKFYDMLQVASERRPIPKNTEGSYLTFRSPDGLVFAFDLFVAGFSTVWLDQAYWQRAIASRPETSVQAYILGGVAWYGIPFGISTAMGLGAAALTYSPSFATYPEPLTSAQVAAGLSAPATAITLMGQGGAVLMLILLFMAVTSSTSAELIAVSSLLTFDVYKTYIKPDAPSHRLVQISHYGIVIYSVVLAAFCCILNAVSLNLTWLVTVLGIIVGGGSIPVGFVLLWERTSWFAAIASPWIGLAAGLTAWLVTTVKRSGAITIENTGDTTNAVAGNLTSWGTGFLMVIVLSLLFPKKYETSDPFEIERYNKIQGKKTIDGIALKTSTTASESAAAAAKEKETELGSSSPKDEKAESSAEAKPMPTGNELVDYLQTQFMEPMDPEQVKRSTRLAYGFNILFFLIAIVLVPFTLFGSGYVFNRAFFRGYVVVSFLWIWVSMVICVIYPVVESTGALRDISRGLFSDFTALLGRRKTKLGNRADTVP